jgi:hypothetical protein
MRLELHEPPFDEMHAYPHYCHFLASGALSLLEGCPEPAASRLPARIMTDCHPDGSPAVKRCPFCSRAACYTPCLPSFPCCYLLPRVDGLLIILQNLELWQLKSVKQTRDICHELGCSKAGHSRNAFLYQATAISWFPPSSSLPAHFRAFRPFSSSLHPAHTAFKS